MSLLPDLKTSYTALQTKRVFQTILLELKLGVPELAKSCPVFMAQSALETAHWNSMHANNWGNIRPGTGWLGDIVQFRCNEYIGGKVVWFDAPRVGEPGYADPRHGSSFRGFTSDIIGARDYFGFIQKHYPEAYAAALAGDAGLFVHGLKARGYFTADEAPYRSAVTLLVGGYAKLAETPLYVPPGLDWDSFRHMRAAADIGAFAYPVDSDSGHSGVDVENQDA